MPSRYLSRPKSKIGARLRDSLLAASRACATAEPRVSTEIRHPPLSSLAPQLERPVHHGLPHFVAGGRRKAQADQKRHSPAHPVGYHANPLRSSFL
ncbi:hypothetical protein B0G73_1383 [Paraburkholderia sp. BL25I1N1]|nr:hypothetical protein B0G73_1383 [Paraburkholderia sp. BL25I1N1]